MFWGTWFSWKKMKIFFFLYPLIMAVQFNHSNTKRRLSMICKDCSSSDTVLWGCWTTYWSSNVEKHPWSWSQIIKAALSSLLHFLIQGYSAACDIAHNPGNSFCNACLMYQYAVQKLWSPTVSFSPPAMLVAHQLCL